MRVVRQQKIQSPSIFKNPVSIQQTTNRYVSEYKPRSNADRQKDKIRQTAVKRSLFQLQFPSNQEQNHHVNRYRYRPDSYAPNEDEVIELHNRSKSFVSKKSLLNQKAYTKGNDVNLMFINIKEALKQNQAATKSIKQGQKEPFLALRSSLKQQLFKNQQNRDFYPYKIDPSVEEQIARSLILQQRIGKCVLNPLFADQAVRFSSAVLNKPIKNESHLEHYLIGRANTESITKNTPKINRFSNLKKLKCFAAYNCEIDSSYNKKLKNFLDFIFKINFSNNIYVDLRLSKYENPKDCRSYKVYVGRGNNSTMVESLLKRRFWWQITHNSYDQDITFYWTQNKVDKFHHRLIQTEKNRIKQQRAECANKKIKMSEEQLYNNRRILCQEKCVQVQNYINADSFFIPFSSTYEPDIITNHLPRNNCIGSKKNLFKSLFSYYNSLNKNPFQVIPKTYHIYSTQSEQYADFQRQNSKDPQKIWIIKPGENSNRGKSISLAPFYALDNLFARQKGQKQQTGTFIIQSYINKPFLYNNRKFDIRHYMMLTSVNGTIKAYWYKEGYIRTSSFAFNLQDTDNLFIHLTNDAIQKNGELYEKYEPANKLSYTEFQRYLQITYPNRQYSFERDILAKMKEITTDIVKANYLTIDHNRLKNNFQIFGLDFMIDKEFKPWLIEVNYNPCLEVNCHVLERVIPGMLQNSLRIGLDPLYPPPSHYPTSKRFYLSDNYLKHLKYQLIFDQSILNEPIINNYDFQDESSEKQECYLQEIRESTEIN